MTLVADTYRGRVEELEAELEHSPDSDTADSSPEPVHVVIDDTDRRRSRFRTTSVDGRDVGVTVGRTLRDGDVLDADGTPVVVELEPIPALAVSLGALEPSEAVAFGHALGNRHRGLAVADGRALVPIQGDAENPQAVILDELPTDVDLDRTTVPPSVFDDDHDGHDTQAATADGTVGSDHGEHRHPGGQHHGSSHRHTDTGGRTDSHGHTHDHSGSADSHHTQEDRP